MVKLKFQMVLAMFLFTAVSAFGNSLPKPEGAVLLTVSGNISVTNQGDQAVLDRRMLMSMPVTGFKTKTIWTKGKQLFKGVSLHELLESLGVTEGTLKATAINDYSVLIPVSDAVEGGPIVSYSRNGALMSVRDKGPLWIVYPYDSNTAYQTEQVFSRSIWQLDRIEILE